MTATQQALVIDYSRVVAEHSEPAARFEANTAP